jgi:transposase
MNKPNEFAPEVRERAMRLAQEHRREYPSLWAAVESIAPKIGCVPQTLLDWVKRHEVDTCVRRGVTTAETQRVKDLEREVKELRRANEILKLASSFFAQAELDRRLKSTAQSIRDSNETRGHLPCFAFGNLSTKLFFDESHLPKNILPRAVHSYTLTNFLGTYEPDMCPTGHIQN